MARKNPLGDHLLRARGKGTAWTTGPLPERLG